MNELPTCERRLKAPAPKLEVFFIPGLKKPRVMYDIMTALHVGVGLRAVVLAFDHPRLGTTKIVTTGILGYDEVTGIFETKNTLYYPTPF